MKKEFKVGDRVKNISDDNYDLTIGKVYVIIEAEADGWYSVIDDIGEPNSIHKRNFEHVPEFEQGQMVEVSHDGRTWYIREYLCQMINGESVVKSPDGLSFHPQTHCRHIQTKPVPKYTMEEAIKLVGHEFEIKK